MATTVKLSFNVHCRALKPGEAVHVCLADPGSSSYDASKSVALTRTAADGGDTPAPAAFTMWSSSKPLTVAWGVQLRYKYAVFLHGAFAYFEKLSSDDRRVVPSGKSMTVEDTFGESDDDRVRAELESRGRRSDDAAKAEAANARLRSDLGAGRKVMLITYTLPVSLYKDPASGSWSAAWREDDFIARTPDSIADAVDTIWVGCVTADCIVSSPPQPAGGADGGAGVPKPVTTPLFDCLTAGGVYNPRGASAPVPPDVPVTTARMGGRAGVGVDVRTGGVDVEVRPSDRGAGGDTSFPVALSQEDMRGITAACNALNAVPVFLPPPLHEAFASYCLSVLRPALHNVLETGAQRMFPYASQLGYLSEYWRYYLAANEAVARAVWSVYSPGDVAWLHDYQLCMVPLYLARWGSAAHGLRPRCVFFMHSPFPTSEIFRTVPVRDELLGALLEADVVGFHTFNSARHFLHSAKRLLGVSFQSRQGGALALEVNGRDVLVAISHVGVEAAALSRWMASPHAAAVAESFRVRYAGKVILAGIDSCQRMSGVAMKLLAFERLLEENPVYRERVVLVQRVEIRPGLNADVARTGAEIRERVARIRATYGDVLDYEEAPQYGPTYRVGLFHQADILLQTPIREGLNLTPLEYVYVRTRWQIARSKAYYASQLAARGDAAGAAAAAAAGEEEEEEAGGGPASQSRRRSPPVPERPNPGHTTVPSSSLSAGLGGASPLSASAQATPMVGLPVALPDSVSSAAALTGSVPSSTSSASSAGAATPADDGGSHRHHLHEQHHHHLHSADAEQDGGGGGGSGGGGDGDVTDPSVMALLAHGMPEYYATLAAPPSVGRGLGRASSFSERASKSGRGVRASLSGAFSSPGGDGGPASSPRSADAAGFTDPSTSSSAAAAPGSVSTPRGASFSGGLPHHRLMTSVMEGSSSGESTQGATAGGSAEGGSAVTPGGAGLRLRAGGSRLGIDTSASSSGLGAIDSPVAVAAAISRESERAVHGAASGLAGGDGAHASSESAFPGAGAASALGAGGAPYEEAEGDEEASDAHDGPLTAPLPPPGRGGCVLLSEFSTAAHILNSNLLVNPWNIGRTAKEIDAALSMPDHERSFRQWRDYQYAIRNPAASWSRQLITDVLEARKSTAHATVPVPLALPAAGAAAGGTTPALRSPAMRPLASPLASVLPGAVTASGAGFNALVLPSAAPKASGPVGPPVLDTASVLSAFKASKRRLLVIDYGGTIMNRDPESRADFTVDGYSKHIPPGVLQALAALSSAPGTVVYIVSGLRSATVENTHLARLPHVGLAAENGMFVSYPVTPYGGSGGGAGAGEGGGLAFEIGDAFGAPPTPSSSGVGDSTPTGSRGSHASPAGHEAPHEADFAALGKAPGMQATGPHHRLSAIHPPQLRLSADQQHQPASGGDGGSARGAARHSAMFSPPRTWTALPLADAAVASGMAPAPAGGADGSASTAGPGGADAAAATGLAPSPAHSTASGATSATSTTTASGSESGATSGAGAEGAGGAPSSSSSTARLLAEWAGIKRRALAIMSDYQWRVNGSYVKEYDSLVAWDFRLADSEWAAPQAKFLAADLEAFASSAVKVTLRKTRVELSLRAMNKGRLLGSLLQRTAAALGASVAQGSPSAPASSSDVTASGLHEASAEPPLDFILVAGDDTTDEAMFEAVHEWASRYRGQLDVGADEGEGATPTPAGAHAPPPPTVVTVSIGHGKRTVAQAKLPDVDAMQRLVADLARAQAEVEAEGAHDAAR